MFSSDSEKDFELSNDRQLFKAAEVLQLKK